MPTFGLPVVFYVRVSSDRQKEAHTVEGQIDALNRYCEREGIAPSAVYKDEGTNGDLPFLSRPDGTRLLEDAKRGEFATVLVYLFDRFSRDTYEGLAGARALKEAGAHPFSIMEPFDITTPFGTYMFIQSLNNAQLNKAQFLERTRSGARLKARAGQWNGGSPPFGYRVVGKPGGRRLEPDEETILPGLMLSPADTVRWMFQRMAHEGGTCHSLSAYLNAVGLPPPYTLSGRKRPPRDGKRNASGVVQWTATTTHAILNSTTYKGIMRYSKNGPDIIEATCPALVSEEVWQAAHRALKRNKTYSARNTRRHYLLRGLIKCGICGGTFCGRTFDIAKAEETNGQKGMAYYCYRTHDQQGRDYPPCKSATIPGRIEHEVWEDIAGFLADPDRVARRIEDMLASTNVDTSEADEAALIDIERRIAGKENERDTILTLFRTGRIKPEALDRQMSAIDAEEVTLHRERTGRQKALETSRAMQRAATDAAGMLAGIAMRYAGRDMSEVAFDEKRALVETLVEEVIVQTERTEGKQGTGKNGEAVVTIRYRFGDHTDTENLPIVLDTVRRM